MSHFKNISANEKLLESAQLGDPQGVEGALAAGADVDAMSNEGWTGAMFATLHGHGACLGLLIAAGAGLDAKDGNGWTVSMLAAFHGHGECLGFLIAAGVDSFHVRGLAWE